MTRKGRTREFLVFYASPFKFPQVHICHEISCIPYLTLWYLMVNSGSTHIPPLFPDPECLLISQLIIKIGKIINCEIRSHSGSGKRGGICLLPEFTIR